MAIDNRVVALHLAELRGRAVFLGPDGSALHDSFETLDYLDQTLSLNIDTSLAGAIGAAEPTPVAIVPDMTGNSAPSPFVVSASVSDSWSGGGAPYQAFDRDNATGWYAASDPAALMIDMGSAKTVGSFTLRSRHNYSSTYNGFPEAFTLYGSSNGADWTEIDTFTAEGWSNGETRTFDLTAPATYRHFRITVTDGSTGNVIIAEAQFYPPVTPLDMTLVSKGIAADTVPAEMSAVVQLATDGTVNTDLTLELSRDNGTTWTIATLVEQYEQEDGLTVFAALNVDVSGQPSGQALRYRLKSDNGAGVLIDGVALWGDA